MRTLAKVPLFVGLTEDDLGALAAIGRRRTLERGEILFLSGTPAEGFFVVLFGRVKLSKLSPAGKEQILHLHGPGETFGEAALGDGARYPAQAVATKPSEVLLIPRAEFQELLGRRPVLATNLIASLSRRIRDMALLVEDLSLRDAPARLARYLLDLTGASAGAGAVLTLPMSKGELASLLGTRQETLSRGFRLLADAGFVEVNGGDVTILDPAGLSDMAEGY